MVSKPCRSLFGEKSMANIDELSIVIQSDTEQAVQSINTLIGSLRNLNTNLNLGNLNTFTRQLRTISTASAGLKDLGKNLEKVAKSSERIKGLSGFKSVEEEVKETDRVSTRLANTLSGKFNFDFAKDGAANTAELRSAIRQVVEDLRNGKQVTDEMSASMGELIAKFSHAKLPMPISGKDQMKLGLLPEGYFDSIGKDIIGKIQTELDKLEPKDVLGNIVPNLEKLAGVTLPDFSGIGVLADGMSKLSRVNSDKIAAIVNALHGIGDANIGNASNIAGQVQNITGALENVKASDTALSTMTNNAQQATQAVALLTDKMHGFSGYSQSMETAAEMFNRIAREFAAMAMQVNTLPAVIPQTVEQLSSGFEIAVQNTRELSDAIDMTVEKLSGDVIGNPFSSIVNDIPRIEGAVEAIDAEYHEIYDTTEDVGDAVEEVGNRGEEAGRRGVNAAQRVQRSNIDLLASLVSLGHEIEHIAHTLDHFGDLGIKGLKFAFKPLDNAIKEYKEKIEGIGNAFKAMADKARRHIDRISAFWKRAMKTFTFMLVRKAITAIITEMSDAIKSLAVWSKQFGTIFNDSISQITSNFSYIARSIVGAFEPIINFVVPAFNALADAIANVMAKLGEFFAAMTGQGYYMAAKKQVVDYAEEVEKARKAQKNLIAGLDDLNVITTPTATNSGMDDVAEQWKKVDVSDKMKEFADEVKKFAKRLFDPIKKAWDNAGQHVLDGWKYMTGEIKKLLKDIGRDLLTVWEQPETQAILENLLHTIGYIEEGIGNLAKKFREAWNTNDVGLHILENIRDIIGIITSHVEDMAKKFRDWADTLDFYPLLEAFENFTKKIQPFVNFLMDVLGDIWEDVILRHWKWQIEEGLPHVLETISEVISAFNWDKIRKDLKPLWTAFETMRENIEKGIVNAFGNLGKRIAEFANSEDFTNFTKNVAWFMDQITAERVEKLFTALGDAILNVTEALMKFVGSDDFKDFINKIMEWYDSKSAEDIADGLTKIAIAIGAFKFAGFLGKGLGEFFKFLSILQSLKGVGGIGGLLGGATGGSIATTLTSLAAAAGIIVGVVAAIYSLVESFGGVQGVLEELKKHFDNIKKAMSDAFERSGIADSINRLKDSFNGLLKALGNQKSLWQALFTLIEGAVILLGNVLLPIIQGVIDAFSASMEFLGGILNFVGGIFDMLKGFFTGDSDLIAEGARRMCEGIYFAFKGLFDLLAVPGSIIHKMVEGIAGFFSWLKEKLIGDPIVLDLVDGVVLAFAGMVKDVIEAIDGFVGDMVKLFTDLKDKAIEKIQELKEKVIAKFTELKNKAIEKFNELKTKVVAKASELKNEVVNKVHALKEEALQKFNELKERAVGTFNNLKNDATSVFNNLKSDIVGIAGQASNDVVGKFWEMVDGASQAFNGVLTAGWNIMSGLGSTLTSAVGDLWSTAKSWGKNILDGLNVGLNNSDGWRNVKRSVGLLVDAVDSTWRTLTRTYSPSRMFMDFGEYLVEGLNVGIDENIGSSEKEVKKWFDDIAKISLPEFDFSQVLPKDNLKMDSYQHLSGTASLDNTGIQESVRSGVMDAVGSLILPYLNDIAQSSRETANKELRIGDKQIGQSAQRYARDFQTRTGKPAYA